MRSHNSFTTLIFLLAAVIISIIASPVEQSINEAAIAERALTIHQGQCASPSQIDLSENVSVGGCNWKLWAVCVGVTGGVCWEFCAAGGFVPHS